MSAPRSIEWVGDVDGHVVLIDQTLLPTTLICRECRSVEEVWEAIRALRIRGAPAIGIAAAMGLVLAMQRHREHDTYFAKLRQQCGYLRTSRPTAVNLFWALDRME